ncbi:hypothetical protein GINT2_000753 [Glugoides intestinalis]
MSDTIDEIPLEQVEEYVEVIKSSVKDLETLEVYCEQKNGIHLAYNTEKSENIPHLVSFLNDLGLDANVDQEAEFQQKLSKSASASDFLYKNNKYTFNRVAGVSDENISTIFISRDAVNGQKLALLLILDASGVIFIATCKVEALRRFNLELMTVLYPNS